MLGAMMRLRKGALTCGIFLGSLLATASASATVFVFDQTSPGFFPGGQYEQ
jgi:hypothetical protein